MEYRTVAIPTRADATAASSPRCCSRASRCWYARSASGIFRWKYNALPRFWRPSPSSLRLPVRFASSMTRSYSDWALAYCIMTAAWLAIRATAATSSVFTRSGSAASNASRSSAVPAATTAAARSSAGDPSLTTFHSPPSMTSVSADWLTEDITKGGPPGTRGRPVRSRRADTRTRSRSPTDTARRISISENRSSADSNRYFRLSR